MVLLLVFKIVYLFLQPSLKKMKDIIYCKFTFICLAFMLGISVPFYAQDCSNDSTGLIPIIDLEDGFYQGFQGGLYFGSNDKPIQQVNNLNHAISNILPLNTYGLYDDNNGKIVLLSIGASNPKTEFQSFLNITDTFSLINPYLTIVNGGQGGKGLQKIIDPNESYWKYVDKQLTSRAVNRFQVQVIWLEEDNTQVTNTSFPSAPQELGTEFKALFKVLLENSPNLQICYLNARGYSGFVDDVSTASSGLRHPRDYYNGWAMKWLIEDQIMGDTTLTFMGTNRKSPVLDWSAYLWSDGNNPRNDGFFMQCPDDLKPDDGLHWSPSGNDKAGNAIFDRFYSDNEARKWFLKNTTTSVINETGSTYFEVYPNPMNDFFNIKSNFEHVFDIYIYSAQGKLVKVERDLTNEQIIRPNLQQGLYFLKVKAKNSELFCIKMIVHR